MMELQRRGPFPSTLLSLLCSAFLSSVGWSLYLDVLFLKFVSGKQSNGYLKISRVV